MALPLPSFLSKISEFARATLAGALFTVDSAYKVTVDSPSGAQKRQDAATDKAGALNLFFYRFEPSGFFPQGGSGERWHIRARCLVTAFSMDGQEPGPGGALVTVTAGEIDLRVLGSVMRHFHEHPVMANGAEGLHLEVVPGTLSSEEINQIWMSQHDVPYRPSLLYEFALLPVEPVVHAPPPLPVLAGGTHSGVRARIGAVAVPTIVPQSPWMEIAADAGWTPLISFVSADNKAVPSLKAALNPVPVFRVWIAGQVGEVVELSWERMKDGEWQPVGAPLAMTVPVQPAGLAGRIDPARAADAATVQIGPPVPQVGTYLLYARRDGRRSNPLMLHLTGAP